LTGGWCDFSFCGWGEMDHLSIVCLLILLWVQQSYTSHHIPTFHSIFASPSL
jgi:hypothetical protein